MASHDEEQFRTLADSMAHLAWIAEADGSIFWYNRRWYEYTGKTPEEMKGWGWQSVHEPAVLPQVLELWRLALEMGEPFEMTFPLRGADGIFRPFLTRAVPVKDAAGKVVRWCGTNTDITAQRETEEALRLSRERLQASLDAAGTGTFHWDLRTNALDLDENLVQLFGLRPGETVRSLEEFLERVHPEDRPEVIARCQRSAYEGADFEMEFRVRLPDGRVRWLYDRGKTWRDGAGKPVYMTGACVDIAGRKEAEAAITERARIAAVGADVGVALTAGNSLREMLTLCTDAMVRHLDAAFARIWILDEAGETLELQASSGLYTHIDGAHSRVPVGKLKIGRIAQEKKPHFTNDVVNDPQPGDREWALRESMVAFAGYPLIVEDRLIGVAALFARQKIETAVLQALSATANTIALGIERKRAADELRQARDTAEAASRAKSDFLASMSHELRTPLNAIIGYSEMLQEEAEEVGQASLLQDLRKIHVAGKHLLSLISDILDLSKIEAGRMDLYAENFDVAVAVEEVAVTVQPLINKNGNVLMLEMANAIGSMHSDLTKVRQSLFNLLSNAAKFTNQGRITLRVTSGTDDGLDMLRFTVSDTGVGIGPEKLDQLFQPFAQLGCSPAQKQGGTGLGLAITKRFCEMMGGTIAVRSQPGVGTEFSILLPRNVESATAEGLRADPASERTANRLTVLVIDDDSTARELMQRYLEKERVQTVLAANGEEGLRLARQLKPDLITLDVLMPGMDGWAVLQALKADPELSEIPIIMVSVVTDRGLAFGLGAADYLLKPIDREKLHQLVTRHCQPEDCIVLVVEDDPESREILLAQLEKQKCRIEIAENGRQALSLLEKQKPHLILLDLLMPEMDGFEFTSELRRNPAWRDIPVIVVTAKEVGTEERRRLNGNIERILKKGAYDREDLLREVRQYLRRAARSA